MNRIFQTVLCILIIVLPVRGQDPDTIPRPADTIPRPADTIPRRTGAIRQDPDTITRYFDTIPQETDTLAVREPDFSHSPSKAIMYALVLPGLGQVYNRKYYKIPIVYGGLAAAVYAIVFNSGEYRLASLEYAENQDELNKRYLEYWRRNMELSYIALVGVYALQVLDAYVDAQLYSWDVNENLSLRLTPSLQPVKVPAEVPPQLLGLTCRFEFKGR